MPETLDRSESGLLVFISSVMNEEMMCAREGARREINAIDFGRPWVFEFTPASSETAVDGYLRKVKEADFVIWLVGSKTTQPVVDEINQSIAANRRLLVFKLPAAERDARTLALLETVGELVKWQEVDCPAQLSEHIRLALGDEIVRALRHSAVSLRKKRLRDLLLLSTSRCRRAWKALGVNEELATTLAQDLEVGNLLDFPSSGVHFVVGEQGAGKSLASERLLQRAIESTIENSSEPFPVHISARDLRGSLLSFIGAECQGYADPYTQRVFLVIDGLDEIGIREGNDLLRDVYTFAGASPSATIVVTTRPLPGLSFEGEQIAIPSLDDEQIVKLLRLISGHPFKTMHVQSWPASMREVAKYPLFALMIGARTRENPQYAFSSLNQLIEQLAEDALRDAHEDSEDLDRLLHRLAVLAIKDGKAVHPRCVDRSLRRQQIITASRLVTESGGAVDFSLSIFREWYAARAVLEGSIEVKEIERASDRWMIPLGLVLNSGDEEVIDSLMSHLSSTDPGLAGRLLYQHHHEHMKTQLGDQVKVPSLDSAVEVGEKLNKALLAWKQGLGNLYTAIHRVKPDGDVKVLSVGIDGRYIMTRWHHYRETESPIDVIPKEDWGARSSDWSIYGMEVPNSDAWSWVFTRDYLAHCLEREFRNLIPGVVSEDAVRASLCWETSAIRCNWEVKTSRGVHDPLIGQSTVWKYPIPTRGVGYSLGTTWPIASRESFRNLIPGVVSEDAVRELCWDFALDVNGKGELARAQMNISEVLYYIGEMCLDEVGSITFGATTYSRPAIDAIRKHMTGLLANGDSVISDPWPSFDRPLVSGSMRQLYSDQRLLECDTFLAITAPRRARSARLLVGSMPTPSRKRSRFPRSSCQPSSFCSLQLSRSDSGRSLR